jgi:ribonuclease PH
MRTDGRQNNEIRPVTFTPGYIRYPEGSVLISLGNTKVLCNATVDEAIPRWMQVQGKSGGWITGEYAMLPRSTHQRSPRETNGVGGRTHEIRRLIGRSLRAAVDLNLLGSRTIILDCDVLQADGGTRTAAITGGYLALAIALHKLIKAGALQPQVLKAPLAAISVGVVQGVPMLDLCYQEDSTADVDVNVVKNAHGEYIEVQSTAEGAGFSCTMLAELLGLADLGIEQVLALQKQVLVDYLS